MSLELTGEHWKFEATSNLFPTPVHLALIKVPANTEIISHAFTSMVI